MIKARFIKLRSTLYIFMMLFLCSTSPQAQEDIGELFDPAPTAGMLDLAQVPFIVDIMQKIALIFSENTLKMNFIEQFKDAQSFIQKEIEGSKMGYLVSVEVYADEFGTPVIPAGQLVFPVGKGVEPLDALAEHFRTNNLRTERPKGLTNHSYYIWLKMRDGKLTGSRIPRELTNTLDRAANDEAARRNLMGSWVTSPTNGIAKIQRAEYWSDVATKYAALLESNERKGRIKKMTEDFKNAQQSFNEKYKRYQETVAEMTRIQAYNSTLEAISNIADLISSAVNLGDMISSTNPGVKVKTAADPQDNIKATIQHNKTTYNFLTGESYERTIIEIQGSELNKLDQKLKEEYTKESITLPATQDNFELPKPD